MFQTQVHFLIYKEKIVTSEILVKVKFKQGFTKVF